MLNATSPLYDLIELAKERSSEKRRQLLRTLADAFLGSATDLNEAECRQFGAILTRLASEMNADIRRQLAAQFAPLPTAPHELIYNLADDADLSVSREVLRQSIVLRDADLVEIVGRAVREKIELIAGRETVSESVSEAIVARGEENAIVRLLTNDGARLSRKTMTDVVARSESNEALQAPLARRNDVPPELLQQMFAFFRSDLRAKIIEKLDKVSPEILESALAHAAQELADATRRSFAADRRAKLQIDDLSRRGLLNEDSLTQLLRDGETSAFVHAFARLADIDLRTAYRLFNNNNAQGIAVVCRAHRFDRTTFAFVALHLEARANGKNLNTPAILDLYDKVSPESAQRVMRFWRVRNAAHAASLRSTMQTSLESTGVRSA